MNRNRSFGWTWLGLALLLGSLAGGGPVLAWGPYAQEVIAFESGGPYVKRPAADEGSLREIGFEEALFFSQAAMPKAWEYAGRAEYAKTSEDFALLMAKLAESRGAGVQSQAWRASQIAEIIGDDMYFGAFAETTHERWFFELLVDAVLHGGNFDTGFPFERVRVSVRPKQVAETSAIFVKSHGGGELISETAVLAMAHDHALAMLGERVMVRQKTFQENGLNNTMPGLWIPAMRTSADEVGKRLAGGLGNPDPVNPPIPDNLGRLGFELLVEMGRIVAGSGAGGIVTSSKKGTVVLEILVKDQRAAEKVVIGFLRDKIWRMKTDPRTKTLCLDLLRLMTKDLYGWTPTPLWRDPR